MGVDDALALKSVLESNATLTSLDLRHNPKLWPEDTPDASAPALDALVSGLRANAALERVLVDDLPLTLRELKGSEPTATCLLYTSPSPRDS